MSIYNLLIPEERKTKDTGEIKTFWHRVGSAFENKGGGFSLVIPEGVSISGRVVMLPRDQKEPESAADAFDENN